MVAEGLSKIVVVTINIIFLIFGLAVLIVGIVFKVGWDDLRDAFVEESDKVDFNLQYAGDVIGIAAIVLGCFIVLVSIMGCIGGCCKVKILLAIYAIIVLILLIAEIVIVALVAANGSDAEDKIKEGLRESLKNYDEDQGDSKSKAWSAVFSTFECCGVDNRTYDFIPSTGFKKSQFRNGTAQRDDPNPIPIACCSQFDYEGTIDAKVFTDQNKCLVDKTADVSYMTGCETEIKDRITDNIGIVIGVGVAILVIELLVVILSFYLACCSGGKDYMA